MEITNPSTAGANLRMVTNLFDGNETDENMGAVTSAAVTTAGIVVTDSVIVAAAAVTAHLQPLKPSHPTTEYNPALLPSHPTILPPAKAE